jgi:mono/diheme cytochrome c family protein
MKLLTVFFSAAAVVCSLSGVAIGQNNGATLFQSRCVMCHGADGKGTPTGAALKVVNLHSPTVKKLSNAEMATVIRKGKNMMPAFGNSLTSPQIESLISHIRELQKK